MHHWKVLQDIIYARLMSYLVLINFVEVYSLLILNPDTYKMLIRPLLFNLPPETAQSLADAALKRHSLWKIVSPLPSFITSYSISNCSP